MKPVVTQVAATIGICFTVTVVFNHFIPNLSWPAYAGIGATVGVILGVLDSHSNRKRGQGR